VSSIRASRLARSLEADFFADGIRQSLEFPSVLRQDAAMLQKQILDPLEALLDPLKALGIDAIHFGNPSQKGSLILQEDRYRLF
jgi:hypothetical protein